jgi:electron transfer flavoprotein beta subunit
MNILVPLHFLLDPAGFTVNRRAQKIFVNREDYLINPSDKNALEAALALEAQVVVVAFDGKYAEDTLRQARAMGAHRALLIKDPALKTADAFVLTNILHHLVNHLGNIDLVLLGAEVPHTDLAQVGRRLSTALDWPFVAVHQIEINDRQLRAIAQRDMTFHNVEADLPAVITLARDSNKPRYPRGLDLVNIYRDPGAIETLTTTDLQLAEADLTPVTELRGESFPPERELGKRLEGDVSAMAHQIAKVINSI